MNLVDMMTFDYPAKTPGKDHLYVIDGNFLKGGRKSGIDFSLGYWDRINDVRDYLDHQPSTLTDDLRRICHLEEGAKIYAYITKIFIMPSGNCYAKPVERLEYFTC